jgi:hypothetical protein
MTAISKPNNGFTGKSALITSERSAMNQELIEAAMDELENYPAGGIGKSGPTLDELDEHVELTGCNWEGDACYHVMQRAWRLLEKWMSQTTEA